MNIPLITVFVYAFNDKDALIRTLESLYNQSYKNIRICVLYDNVPYFPDADLIKFSPKMPNVIHFACNTGSIPECYNRGLSFSRLDLFSFLIEGDVLYPYALETLQKGLVGDNYDLVYGQISTINILTNRAEPNTYGKQDTKISHVATLIKGDILDCIGAFDSDLKSSFFQNLYDRIKKKGKLRRIEKNVGVFKIGDFSHPLMKYKKDYKTGDSFKKAYPLSGYWFRRKRLPYLGSDSGLVDLVNSKNLPWIASRIGDNSAPISPTVFPTSHNAILTRNQLIAAYNRPTVPFCLRFACLNVTQGNIDTLLEIMRKICKKYQGAYLVIKENPNYAQMFTETKGLVLKELPQVNFESLSNLKISAIISLLPEEDYNTAGIHFKYSILLKTLLISYPNTLYAQMNMSNVISLFQNPNQAVEIVEYFFNNKPIISEFFAKYLARATYFLLDDVNIGKLIISNYFTNSFVSTLSEKPALSVMGHYQLAESGDIFFSPTDTFMQSITKYSYSELHGVSFIIKPINNHADSKITLTVKTVLDQVLGETSLMGADIKNGDNIFKFDTPILDTLDKELIFELKCQKQSFNLRWDNSIKTIGLLYINGYAQRGCLTFITYLG